MTVDAQCVNIYCCAVIDVLLQVFKRLFNDGLDIQKERINELRKYAKEQREERTRRQQQELEALEN